MTEPELIKLMTKWKDEMKGLVSDYTTLVTKLDSAVQIVESSEKKWWVVYKAHITVGLTIIGVILLVLVLSFVMKVTNTCSVNINTNDQGFAVQSCKADHSKK